MDLSGEPISLLEEATKMKNLVDSSREVGVCDTCRETGERKTCDPPRCAGPSPMGLLNDNFNFLSNKQAVHNDLMRAKVLAVKTKGLVAKERRGW